MSKKLAALAPVAGAMLNMFGGLKRFEVSVEGALL